MVFGGESAGKRGGPLRTSSTQRFEKTGSCATDSGRGDIRTLGNHPEDLTQPHRNFQPTACDPGLEKAQIAGALLKLLRSLPTVLVTYAPPPHKASREHWPLLGGKRCAI